MSTATLYTCDKCRSTTHDNEYRLTTSNFSQLTISLFPVGGGGPMMPGAGGITNRNETFQICAECKAVIEASINEIVNPLKAS